MASPVWSGPPIKGAGFGAAGPMRMLLLRPILSATLLVLAPTWTLAADADPLLNAPEVVLETARSGFYLRGDVSYEFRSDLDGTQDVSVPGVSVAAPSDGRLDEAAVFGAGLGYRFNDMLRVDATLRYGEASLGAAPVALPNCGVPCAGFVGGDAGRLELLGNAYLDLGTVAGFTPYLGAGLGAVRFDYGDAALAACSAAGCSSLGVSGESDWRFAYALNAGVSYDISQALTVDLGYRFLDADGGDAWRSVAGPAVAVSDDGVQRHAISLGLRLNLP